MSPDRQLLTTLAVLRRQWRTRVLLESLVWIAAGVVLAVLAVLVILRVLGGEGSTLLVARLVGYGLIVAAIVRGLVLPLLKRASTERFALYVEERAPQLRQALLAAVQEAQTPVAERASPSLSERLMARASAAIAPLQQGASLERPRMMRAGQTLGAVALGAAALLVFGPVAVRDGAKVLFMPFGTAQAAVPSRTLAIEPGNATVPRGGAIEVQATLVGFAADGAELVFRTDSLAGTGTSNSEWQRLPMAPDSDSARFRSRLFDIVAPTEYYVESADVRSPVYRLTVNDLPAVTRVSLALRFPAYSGLPPEVIDDGGDVAAVVGTNVTVRAKVSRDVAGGTLRFSDGTVVPMTPERDSTGALVVSGSFRVSRSGFYHIDLRTADGTTVAGAVEYVVDAIPDRAPAVRIEEPGRDTKVSNTDEVTIAVRASDDLGLVSLELRYRVNGGSEQKVTITEGSSRRPRDAQGAHTLFLEEMSLSPGDLVAYHAVAKDGSGLVGSSDVYFLEVRPFGKDYRQSEQAGGGGGGGGQEQGNSPDGFVARQREVVAGTFNWLRDSSRTADKKRREDMTTLAIAEGRLRTDVGQLVTRLTERGVAAGDTMFAKIRAELQQATEDLKAAEEQLGRVRGGDALGPEQRALQRLQRAEALYRDVQVQMGGVGGGGGGGGGGQQRAEDLADLFELETDKQRNQYETLQQQRAQDGGQREVDESLERLRQLASRQQQENERMQRMAEAMRQRLAQERGGQGGAQSGSASPGESANGGNTGSNTGSSGAQRELARQAEEEARRLERLSREQNNRELANAAQQLQQAADNMRRAASGSTAQANAALEELNRAARNLEGSRAAETTRGVQQLAERARDLEARQQEIAEGVRNMQRTSGAERGERLQQLAQQKDALSGDVRRLEAEADRLARGARRDQPKAAGQVAEAADAIRDTRLADKIEFSKQVARGGSAEYAAAFEGQIGENLRDVAERLRAATGALQGESVARRQERTLERTRDLVEGMESLRERVAERAQRGQQGQEGQQGQQGQQGQGGNRAGGQAQGAPTQGGSARSAPGEFTPGGRAGYAMPGGDAEQFSREFRMRREAAEGVRREAAQQGVDTRDLDRAIAAMRQLENGRAFSDARGLEQLQSAMVERLKDFEFALLRAVGMGTDGRPAAGARASVPAEYRAMVEEYYRALANGKKR